MSRHQVSDIVVGLCSERDDATGVLRHCISGGVDSVPPTDDVFRKTRNAAEFRSSRPCPYKVETRREEVDPLVDDLTDKEIPVQTGNPDVRIVQSLLTTLPGLGAPQHTRDVTPYDLSDTPWYVTDLLGSWNVTPASLAQPLRVPAGSEACCLKPFARCLCELVGR